MWRHVCVFVQVHNIVDKACKEMAMEKMLRDLEVIKITLLGFTIVLAR